MKHHPLLLILFTIAPASQAATHSNPLDLGVRGALRIPSAEGRRSASLSSDILQYSLLAAPLAVDGYRLLTAPSGARDWRPLAGDAAAFAVTFGLTIAAKELSQRDRPFSQECSANGNYDPGCNSATRKKSFFSGHTALAFTGATLLCHNDLRDEQLPAGVCAGAIGVAAMTGALRIIADKHHFTDVAIGAAVGALSGYFVPKLIGAIAPPPEKTEKPPTPAEAALRSISPLVGSSSYGLQTQLRF